MKAKELIKEIALCYNCLTDEAINDCLAVADNVKESNIFGFSDARTLTQYGLPCVLSLSKVKQLELKEVVSILQNEKFNFDDFCDMLSYMYDDIRIRIADMYPKSKHSTLN